MRWKELSEIINNPIAGNEMFKSYIRKKSLNRLISIIKIKKLLFLFYIISIFFNISHNDYFKLYHLYKAHLFISTQFKTKRSKTERDQAKSFKLSTIE